MNRSILTDEERATLAEQWPELVVKHTRSGACNFQAAADELVAELQAEIERLRRENDDLNAGWQRTYDHDCNWLKSEIERLRLENEALGAAMSSDGADACGALVVANAEIERLRKELAREEEEHNRCTTFHAIAVKERNYERVLSLQKDSEIDRLRKELEAAKERSGGCY